MICSDCEKDKPESDFYCYRVTPMKRCKKCYSKFVYKRTKGRPRTPNAHDRDVLASRAANEQALRDYWNGRDKKAAAQKRTRRRVEVAPAAGDEV